MGIDFQKIVGGDLGGGVLRIRNVLYFVKLCPVLCPVFFVDPALVTATGTSV